MPRRTDISSVLIIGAGVASLSACATPRMHSQAELNSASLSCGLTYGELIQDAEAKKLLILFREKPSAGPMDSFYLFEKFVGMMGK